MQALNVNAFKYPNARTKSWAKKAEKQLTELAKLEWTAQQ